MTQSKATETKRKALLNFVVKKGNKEGLEEIGSLKVFDLIAKVDLNGVTFKGMSIEGISNVLIKQAKIQLDPKLAVDETVNFLVASIALLKCNLKDFPKSQFKERWEGCLEAYEVSLRVIKGEVGTGV